MRIIKKLDTFMLRRFLPLLLMTFCITLFIVLMQFLFRYIDELVGKGLPISAIGELFFYAALTMVPTALPLAVLLASLMTFGNLGEKFELTAMKAAGISLFRIMSPLMILMAMLATGAFFFQNDVLPMAQTKMWTLLFSMRQKSPEVEIPTRTFYSDIPGMNLYVEQKDLNTGMLRDIIIYDVSQGMDNSRVILADSGKLNFTEDKTHLFLHLYRGEMFENIRNSALGSGAQGFLPFRRESFTDKQIYMPFDANFNRMDEGAIRSQYVGKNMSELLVSIDSIQQIVDSVGTEYGRDLRATNYVNIPQYRREMKDTMYIEVPVKPVKMDKPLDLDSIFGANDASRAKTYLSQALARAQQQRENYHFRSMALSEQKTLKNRHGIEMHKKFTLSFACLIFFFIGAPLGAIIKKGGIGTPLVISVFLFIFYFIIDNMGWKMARDSKVAVWEGMWLSSAVLLPMGVFFTYKAIGDSAVFNADAYKAFFMRLIGKQSPRELYVKEVIISEVDNEEAAGRLREFVEYLHALAVRLKKRNPVLRLLRLPPLTKVTERLDDVVDYLANSRDQKVIFMLNRLPMRVNYRNLPHVILTSERLLAYVEGDEDIPLDYSDAPATRTGRKARLKKVVKNVLGLIKKIRPAKKTRKTDIAQTIQPDNTTAVNDIETKDSENPVESTNFTQDPDGRENHT